MPNEFSEIQSSIFISHSSQDKKFVADFARLLNQFRFDVWYDDWEIGVGDSIVEKVFDGLHASDTLVVVLSPNSVESRWVKEELNVAVMRRLSDNDIRILPVLIADCDIPTPLNHIKYADFRDNRDDALSQVLDALSPGHLLWQSLSYLYDHLSMLCDKLSHTDLESEANETITNLHSLLESALDLRTEIEIRRSKQKMGKLNFFEKIGLLVERGVDVRSQTWNELVRHRASISHEMCSRKTSLEIFACRLQKRYDTEDLRLALKSGLDRLKQIMRMICFDKWDDKELKRS